MSWLRWGSHCYGVVVVIAYSHTSKLLGSRVLAMLAALVLTPKLPQSVVTRLSSMLCRALCCFRQLQECIEASLLSALDAETEAWIATQIRVTVTALLAASAPSRPGYWVKLLAAVAVSAGATVTGAAQAAVAGVC
jgi:hypothetical protein